MRIGSKVRHKDFPFIGHVTGQVRPGIWAAKSESSETSVEASEDKWLPVPEVGEPTDPTGKEAGDVIGKTFHG